MSWKKIGSINTSKYGGFTFQVQEDVELKKDERLALKTPREDIESLLANGIINEEQAEERLAKMPDFVKYNVFKVPPKAG